MSETKICTKCKEEFPETTDYFYKSKTGKYGLQSICKQCEIKRNKLYYKNNKEKAKERYKLWIENNKEYKRNYNLKRMYSITLEQWNNIFTEQKGRCLICGKHESQLKRHLVVHHRNGKVRCLLCDMCNKAIGMLGDHNPYIMIKATKLRIKKII